MRHHNYYHSHSLSLIIKEAAIWADNINNQNPDISPYRSATNALDSIRKKYGSLANLPYKKSNDAQTISADYLIKDIDFAFKTWEQVPWGKQISFEEFCTKILPYRISNENISQWREQYYNTFSSIIDSLPYTASHIDACNLLYNKIMERQWYHVDDAETPYIDAITLLENRYGGCREKTAFMLFAMRALCIPGSIDMFIQTPNKMYMYHYWNQINDIQGKPIEFLIGDDHLTPQPGSRDTTRKRGVIYRLNFEVQKNSLAIKRKNKDIPQRLKTPFIANVSSEYYPESKAVLQVINKQEEYLYLCLFNNKEWIPVTHTKIKNHKASFEGVEPGIVYLPAYFKNGVVIPSSAPFLLKQDGILHFFDPDTTIYRNIILERKHPLPNHLFHLKRFLIGGVFQGANDERFNNAKIIYTILDDNELKRTFVKPDASEKYRYIRYLSAENGSCNMAELYFFLKDSVEITGKTIGTTGARNKNPERTIHAVFDKDPLTFFEAPIKSGGWVGVDFGKPQQITQIGFQFRNDDNLIRKGDLYELFYATARGWKSAGRQTGSDTPYLIYNNIPENTLLWLRNLTRGKEERIFSYENGKQIFW